MICLENTVWFSGNKWPALWEVMGSTLLEGFFFLQFGTFSSNCFHSRLNVNNIILILFLYLFLNLSLMISVFIIIMIIISYFLTFNNFYFLSIWIFIFYAFFKLFSYSYLLSWKRTSKWQNKQKIINTKIGNTSNIDFPIILLFIFVFIIFWEFNFNIHQCYQL